MPQRTRIVFTATIKVNLQGQQQERTYRFADQADFDVFLREIDAAPYTALVSTSIDPVSDLQEAVSDLKFCLDRMKGKEFEPEIRERLDRLDYRLGNHRRAR